MNRPYLLRLINLLMTVTEMGRVGMGWVILGASLIGAMVIAVSFVVCCRMIDSFYIGHLFLILSQLLTLMPLLIPFCSELDHKFHDTLVLLHHTSRRFYVISFSVLVCVVICVVLCASLKFAVASNILELKCHLNASLF